MREFQIEQSIAKADAHSVTMYIMAGLLSLGFICNTLIRPVHEKHHIKQEELDEMDGIFPRSDTADSEQTFAGNK